MASNNRNANNRGSNNRNRSGGAGGNRSQGGSRGGQGSSRGRSSASSSGRSNSYGNGPPRWLWAIVGLVVVAVAVIIVVATNKSSSTSSQSGGGMSPSVVKAVTTGVSSSLLEQAGLDPTNVNNLPISLGKQTALAVNGKPEVLYIGAEYCPYCAAERWPLVLALSRFGTFSNLGKTTSSVTDVYPNTPTFSFYKSSFTSPYIVFDSVELATNTGQTLQSPTKAQSALINKFDTAPYIQGQSGSIPFIDFGNKFMQSGAEYSPQILQGLTYDNIAGQMTVSGTNVGGAIDAAANLLTAAICSITNNQPAQVCSTATIRQALVKIEANKPSKPSSANATPGAAG